MGIYGNTFKPAPELSEDVLALLKEQEDNLIQEATELEIFSEAKFHLFKIGDSKEFKDISKTLADAELLLNASGDSIDAGAGRTALKIIDKIVEVVNAGSSIAAIPAPVLFLPVALISKLVSWGVKAGKEAQIKGYVDEAITKLDGLADDEEDEAKKDQINKMIEKLQTQKHTLEVGRKGVKKEEKAVKNLEKSAEKAEKKEEKAEAKEQKKALKAAAKAAKKNKATDDDNEDDDEEITAQVESAVTEGCEGKDCDDKKDDIDESDKDEVNDAAAEEVAKKESGNIYDAFRSLMSEATDEQIEKMLANMQESCKGKSEAKAEDKKEESVDEACKCCDGKDDDKKEDKEDKKEKDDDEEDEVEESTSIVDLYNFMVEHEVTMTEDMKNTFIEAGVLEEESTEPVFESYQDYIKYCLENGIQASREDLEAIKEQFEQKKNNN